MRAQSIVESLELAASRCDDLAPLVYARLFAERPDLAPRFGENGRLVQGEMLARTIETILDFVTGDAYASNLVASEASAHATYDVPPETFAGFFRVVAETLRNLLANDWTGEMDQAWRELLDDLSGLATAEGAAA